MPPLEGLWWAEDMSTFTTARDKSAWDWTLLLLVPDWVPPAMVEAAIEQVGRTKSPPRLAEVRLEELTEGRCVQTLHVGPFDAEAEVLAQLHHEVIPAHGFTLAGKHHEIYLSDVGDMVLRVAMFKSWQVPPGRAVAGTLMNALSFFIVRFSAPLLGFAIVLISGRSLGLRWLDLISLAIAAALGTGLVLLLRTDSWAAWVGRTVGRLVHRVRPAVDPDRWADGCIRFRGEVAARFGYAFPRAVAALLVMLLADLSIMLAALRFVGLGPDQLSVLDVAVAFVFAYPLTAFAMSGLGIVDMVALASLVASGGDPVQVGLLAAGTGRPPSPAKGCCWLMYAPQGEHLGGCHSASGSAVSRMSTRVPQRETHGRPTDR